MTNYPKKLLTALLLMGIANGLATPSELAADERQDCTVPALRLPDASAKF